jgi:hypothetical protein
MNNARPTDRTQPNPTNRQALQERYLEAPKSLRDAAARAWRPIGRRTLDWSRRAHKAAAAAQITRSDLLEFYDHHLSEGARGYRLVCAQVWGGAGKAASKAAAAQAGAGAAGASGAVEIASGGVTPVAFELVVEGGELAAFKRSQPLWPAGAVAAPGGPKS